MRFGGVIDTPGEHAANLCELGRIEASIGQEIVKFEDACLNELHNARRASERIGGLGPRDEVKLARC
jgi:hypothetical protein